MTTTKKIILGTTITMAIIFRLCCGIFIIQPIGLVPEGATIVYWRAGLNIPFIASADGILEKSGEGVSLMGRIIVMGAVAEQLKTRKILNTKYQEWLYKISTNGNTYDR